MVDFFGRSGSSGSGSSTPQSAAGSSSGSKLAPPKVTRPKSSVVVTTVRKKVAVTAPSRTASSSAPPSRNGLPEEARRRIEAQRQAAAEAAAAKAATAARSARSSPASSSNSRHKRPRTDSKASSRQPAKRSHSSRAPTDSSSESDADPSAISARRKRRPDVARSSHDSNGRGSSAGYRDMGREGVLPFYNVPRDVLVDERPCELDEESKPMQSTQVVRQGKLYSLYFNDLPLEQATATLEYPAPGASEKFQLLVSRDPDEYDPISELLRTVYSICAHYMTEAQRESHELGTLDMLEVASLAGHLPSNGAQKRARTATGTASPAVPSSPVTYISSPLPSLPALPSHLREHETATPTSTEASTPDVSTPRSPSGVPADTSLSSVSSTSASASASAPPSLPSAAAAAKPAPEDRILRQLTKARNRRSGPLFLHAVERFNAVMRSLRESGALLENTRAMCATGVPAGLWRMVQEQCYNRAVGPSVEELSGYRAFSDNVYGELLPGFVSELAQLTSLGSSSLFIDLGSGVGNVLIQLALQTGARVCGVEQLAAPARLAALQLEEARRRWRLWGVRGGLMECWQGDFGEDERTRQRLREADVVLVNNYAFTARTNENLSLLFLDLPEGARIVSLKPFVPHDFRLTARTLESPCAVLRVEQRRYGRGCVSWADGGGVYYLHTIDRSMVQAFVERSARGTAPV